MTRIALLLALVATAAGAEKPADFASGVPLTLEGDRAFYRVELPRAVYSGSARADLGDVRVFNADDAMVPYAYVPSPAPVREKRAPIALPLFPLLTDRDGADLSGLSLTVTRNAGGTVVSEAAESRLDGHLTPLIRTIAFGARVDPADVPGGFNAATMKRLSGSPDPCPGSGTVGSSSAIQS